MSHDARSLIQSVSPLISAPAARDVVATSPYVIERSPTGERTYDVFSRLARERVLFLGTGVNSEVVNILMAQLLFLEADAPGKDIHFYINSPGGSVYAGLALYDTMQHISSRVHTTCCGVAASMGAFLLAGGTGVRSALPNARIMIHQPSQHGGDGGTASDLERNLKELLLLKKNLNEVMAANTGQSIETIERDTDRDKWMSAEEAVSYGIIDEVVAPLHQKADRRQWLAQRVQPAKAPVAGAGAQGALPGGARAARRS